MKKPTLPENSRLVFKGQIFDVYQWDQLLFDGSNATFERIKRPDTVQVIPILDNGNILVLEEEQPGTAEMISLPGGRVDEGEQPQAAAKRELLEETGFEPSAIRVWFDFAPYTKIVWTIYYFIAHGLKHVAEPHLDPGEKIRLKEVTFDEFILLPNNQSYDGFMGGGPLNELLIRAQYDASVKDQLKQELEII